MNVTALEFECTTDEPEEYDRYVAPDAVAAAQRHIGVLAAEGDTGMPFCWVRPAGSFDWVKVSVAAWQVAAGRRGKSS